MSKYSFHPLKVLVKGDNKERFFITRTGTGDYGGGIYACNCDKKGLCDHLNSFFEWKDEQYKGDTK